jgi:hypothetical protein
MTKEGPNNTDREGILKGAGESIPPTHESWISFFEARLVPPGNNGVLAWFLYTFGYSSFLSNNKDSSLLALKILKIIDNTLADLLEYRIIQPLPQRQEKNLSNLRPWRD